MVTAQQQQQEHRGPWRKRVREDAWKTEPVANHEGSQMAKDLKTLSYSDLIRKYNGDKYHVVFEWGGIEDSPHTKAGKRARNTTHYGPPLQPSLTAMPEYWGIRRPFGGAAVSRSASAWSKPASKKRKPKRGQPVEQIAQTDDADPLPVLPTIANSRSDLVQMRRRELGLTPPESDAGAPPPAPSVKRKRKVGTLTDGAREGKVKKRTKLQTEEERLDERISARPDKHAKKLAKAEGSNQAAPTGQADAVPPRPKLHERPEDSQEHATSGDMTAAPEQVSAEEEVFAAVAAGVNANASLPAQPADEPVQADTETMQGAERTLPVGEDLSAVDDDVMATAQIGSAGAEAVDTLDDVDGEADMPVLQNRDHEADVEQSGDEIMLEEDELAAMGDAADHHSVNGADAAEAEVGSE